MKNTYFLFKSRLDKISCTKAETHPIYVKRLNYCHREMHKGLMTDLNSKFYNFLVVVGIYSTEKQLYDISTLCVNNGIDCIVIEMPHDMPRSLSRQAETQVTPKDLQFLLKNWQMTPCGMIRLDPKSIEDFKL